MTQVRASLVVFAMLLAVPTASAQLRLAVRAESDLSLAAFEADDGVHVRVRVLDDLGGPVGAALVRLEWVEAPAECPTTRDVHTEADGAVEVIVDRACTARAIRASYLGDRLHEPTSVEAAIARVPPEGELRLRLVGGARLDLDRPSHTLEIRAPEGARARGLHVRVVDELARPLAEGTLDASGRWNVPLASSALGGPGAGRIAATAEVAGDPAARRSVLPVVRFRRTRLTLEEVPDDEAPISVRGRLADSRAGLARQAIAILVDGRPMGAVETDADGTFHFRFVGRPRADGPSVRVEATYVASHPGWTDARSPAREIALERGSRLPDLLFLFPIAIAVAALVRSWIGAEPARRTAPSAAEVELASRPTALRADRRDLAVRVLGRRDGAVIVGALVRLEVAGGAEQTTGANGEARFEALPDGRHRVVITATDHARVTFDATIPHRGEFGAVRVRLSSLRDRALDAFEPIAAEVIGDPQGLGKATVRDVAARARGEDFPSELPSDVERLAFAAPAPEEQEVEHVAERARRFLANRKTGPQPR